MIPPVLAIHCRPAHLAEDMAVTCGFSTTFFVSVFSPRPVLAGSECGNNIFFRFRQHILVPPSTAGDDAVFGV